MKKINNLSFIILGVILLVFAVWSATDSSFSSLKGVEHQETLNKINTCENSKMNKSFESYMTISSQFNVDWSGCDLTGVILRHISLENANLMNVDLSGADLTGADWNDCDPYIVDISHVRDTNFHNAEFMRVYIPCGMDPCPPGETTFEFMISNEGTDKSCLHHPFCDLEPIPH